MSDTTGDPDETAAMLEAAIQLHREGNLSVASGLYTQVIQRQPRNHDALHNLGRLALEVQRPDQAVRLLAQAIALRPELVESHLALGNAQNALSDYEAALESFTAAARLNPASATAHFNRGNVLRLFKQVDAAIESYDTAIALQPDFAIAHHNRAFCLLQTGDLVAGFRAYEWRRKCPTFDDPRYRLDRAWTGEADIAGKTLFIFPELFQGDLIQVCRYALAAERRGARVLLAAPQAMHRLLRSMSPALELLAEDAMPRDFDLQAPLMSLPLAFGTTLASLPQESGYLRAEPERVAHWRERIGAEGLRIGVVWQGSTLPYALPLQRSFPLAALDRISRLPGVRLISLQKHNGLDQLAKLPAGMAVETLGEAFDLGPDAFIDTAAAMACCDLVVTMDTSVAHLAGALGLRTWVALPYISDWRWLIDRTDSPWYPSARLFRQPSRGDWPGVFADMEAALRAEWPAG